MRISRLHEAAEVVRTAWAEFELRELRTLSVLSLPSTLNVGRQATSLTVRSEIGTESSTRSPFESMAVRVAIEGSSLTVASVCNSCRIVLSEMVEIGAVWYSETPK